MDEPWREWANLWNAHRQDGWGDEASLCYLISIAENLAEVIRMSPHDPVSVQDHAKRLGALLSFLDDKFHRTMQRLSEEEFEAIRPSLRKMADG